MPIATAVMRQWMKSTTLAERKAFAKAARTTLPHLHHIANGRRGVKPELAQRLALASATLQNERLLLDQRALCRDCSVCPLVAHPPGPGPAFASRSAPIKSQSKPKLKPKLKSRPKSKLKQSTTRSKLKPAA